MKILRLQCGFSFVAGMLIAVWVSALAPSISFADSKEFNTEVRYFNVQRGQTLNGIVSRLYPGLKKQWPQIRADIIRLNPHAFPGQDESRMRAGARLTLPARSIVKPAPAFPRSMKQVGTVIDSRGRATALGRDRVKRNLAEGKAVYLGDKLSTGESGFMRIQMIDDAIIDLRCLSVLVIEDYNLSDRSRRSVLSLLQGGLRKETGTIGKSDDDVYVMKTRVASIGVRGTEYAMRVYQSKGCDGSAPADDGMYLQVLDGAVDVSNKVAKSAVDDGDSVYIASSKDRPVETEIKPGVLVLEDDVAGDSSTWWWVLGGIALLALL